VYAPGDPYSANGWLAIWLQWWSNAMLNGIPKNRYFFDGYVGFQVGYLVMLGTMCMLSVKPLKF